MALSKTDIKKKLRKELGDFLKEYGYKYDTKAEGFLRNFNDGFNKVGIGIIDYNPKFQVCPYFLIRINEVENIVQKHVFVMDQYRELTYTINIGIEYFTGIKEYEIFTEVELIKLTDYIKDIYTSKVDSFLTHYSNIKNLDKSINDEGAVINGLVEPDNCIRSIIIAKLANNPNFENIAEGYYQKYIKEYDLDVDAGPKRIRETINYLKSM